MRNKSGKVSFISLVIFIIIVSGMIHFGSAESSMESNDTHSVVQSAMQMVSDAEHIEAGE